MEMKVPLYPSILEGENVSFYEGLNRYRCGGHEMKKGTWGRVAALLFSVVLFLSCGCEAAWAGTIVDGKEVGEDGTQGSYLCRGGQYRILDL